MSKEEETLDDFFEYLLALDSISRESKFSPQAEPLENDFWSNLEKDIKKKEEEKRESHAFLESIGLATSKNKPSTHNKIEELEQKMQELENYVYLEMRGPKGDKGVDGVDDDNFDLTKEDIKNAVKEGVIEGVKELLSGNI